MTAIVVNNRVGLKQKIKQKARERILAILPEWKQTNLVARGVELLEKEIAVGGPALTAQEIAEKDYIKAQWVKVKAVRAHSDTLELAVDGGLVADLDSGWPF